MTVSDPPAFNWSREFRARLFAYALSLTRNRADADDLIHRTFIQLAQIQATGKHIVNPEAYARRIARNLLFGDCRRKCPNLELAPNDVDVTADPVSEAIAIETTTRLQTAFDALPDRCRQVYWMRNQLQLPTEDIAQRLGISEWTVRRDLRDALLKLAAAFNPDGSDSK